MCSSPQNHDGNMFACRVCNECITARKNDWVARAMAEKATSNEAMALTLSYRNNKDGSEPDGARAFKYTDVQAFLKRLREEYFRKYHARNEIRYIVAGERGSKKDRVHWHMVLLADRPITTLGLWQDWKNEEIGGVRFNQRLHWSFWREGFVFAQKPDQSGMAYVLKYALKDQFNAVKSKGTMRESKAENHGASYFRMSKAPPIGHRWLEQKCDRLAELGAVVPHINLNIPGYSGFWYPKKKQREYLLLRLHEINEARKAKHGSDCPQWSALLTSVESVENEKDWETLVYGEIDPEQEAFNAQYVADRYAPVLAEKYNPCGGIRVCLKCWRGKGKDGRQDYHRWYAQQVQEYITDTGSPVGTIDRWYRSKEETNPYCTPEQHRREIEASTA